MRGLVQRGQRAAAGRPRGRGGRVVRAGDEGVEPGDAAVAVLGAGGVGPVVVEPGARLAVAVRVVEVAHDRARARRTRASRDTRLGPQRLAQRPDGGAQVGAGVGGVGPEPGGQRVAVVRAGMQREEREQPPVRRRERHRLGRRAPRRSRRAAARAAPVDRTPRDVSSLDSSSALTLP